MILDVWELKRDWSQTAKPAPFPPRRPLPWMRPMVGMFKIKRVKFGVGMRLDYAPKVSRVQCVLINMLAGNAQVQC